MMSDLGHIFFWIILTVFGTILEYFHLQVIAPFLTFSSCDFQSQSVCKTKRKRQKKKKKKADLRAWYSTSKERESLQKTKC